MGDFYPTGVRRGDPGIGSFLMGLGKGALSFLPGGSAVSGAIDAAGALFKKGTAAAAGGGSGIVKRVAEPIAAVATKHPVLTAAGAAGAAGMMMGAGATALMAPGGACPRGHHISKSKHSKSFGKCVRNRRMRVTNPKALRRAIRRTSGFAKLAMRTIHLVHPRKKARFGGFKRKARR